MTDTLLEVDRLSVELHRHGRRARPLRAVDGVSLRVDSHQTVALVGESGAGKSTIGRAILGLTPPSSGMIRLQGQELSGLAADRREELVGEVQVVFQDPFRSLNPARTIGRTLAEPLEVRGRLARGEAEAEVSRLLGEVGIPAAAMGRYPHEFSGGQRQRIAIARALATSPSLVICDEATSSLDVVTQARVLELLDRLSWELGIAYLFIAHDLAVVRQISSSVVVLYRGRVMERGPTAEVIDEPLHPYTQALLAAAPVADPPRQRGRRNRRLHTVSVSTAEAGLPSPEACPFAPRCPHAAEPCWSLRPADTEIGPRTVACHLFDPTSGHRAHTNEQRGQHAPSRERA